jgi:signal transduction histidine kinase
MHSNFYSGKAAYAVAFVLVVLVITLAVFQHNWFGQLSERERDRMQSNIRNGAFQCVMDLAREFSRLQLLGNPDPEASLEKSGIRLQEQLDILRGAKEFHLLLDSVFVLNERARAAWRLDRGALIPVAYPVGRWTNPFVVQENWRRLGPAPNRPIFIHYDLRACCIMDDQTPDERVVVMLNRDYLVDSLFVQVLDIYLGSQRLADLDVLLLEEHEGARDILYASSEAARSIPPDSADVRVPFLGGMPPGSPGPEPRDIHRPRGDDRFRGPDVESMRRGPARMGPMMELRIRHRTGSLEAAVRQNRLINVGIGSGILILLLVGVLLILMISRNAERLARQQIEFVAGVSHELRTPLAVLQSVGDNLADGVITGVPKARAYGKVVRTEVHRLHTMVENALTYAGITSGKFPAADLQPVDLRQIVRKACQASQALLEEHEVQLDLELPDALPEVPGIAPALQSVAENLISNATKYGSDDRWIGIQVEHDPVKAEVTLSVSDHGIGIARQEIPHLFQPFYRGREAIQRQIRGSGLGLNLVHHIVEQHSGKVTVESTPGKGSRFVVHLPTYGTENRA